MEEASDNEQEQYKYDTNTEDLCHINKTEYKEDSDSEEYGCNTNDINVNLQQTSRIGIDIEQHSPSSDVCNITQHWFDDLSVTKENTSGSEFYDTFNDQTNKAKSILSEL
eukprot:12242045-Ditylum_brightwellii.AAC.1